MTTTSCQVERVAVEHVQSKWCGVKYVTMYPSQVEEAEPGTPGDVHEFLVYVHGRWKKAHEVLLQTMQTMQTMQPMQPHTLVPEWGALHKNGSRWSLTRYSS